MTTPPQTGQNTPAADAAHAARGGVTQLFGTIAQLLMPVYHVVVARLFGQAAFGIYQSAMVVIEVSTRFGFMGGDKAMHRFIAAHRAAGEDDLAQRALGSALRVSLSVAATLAVALALSSGFIARVTGKPDLQRMLPIMGAAILPSAAMMILVSATLGAKVTRIHLIVRGFIEPCFLLLAAVAVFAFGGGILGLAGAHLGANLATLTAASIGASFVFGRRWLVRALRAPMHPRLVGFAVPVALAELGNVVLQKADFFILGFFVSNSELAVYAAAEFLGRIAANVRYAFDGVAAPVLSEALHLGHRDRLRYNLALMTRWVATLTLPLAITMIALRHQALSLYGPGFVAGTSLVCVWTVTHMLNGCLGLIGHVLMMSGRSRIYLINQLVAASLNIVLSLILIPRLGLMGAAIAALIAVNAPLVATVLEVWALEHVHPFDRPLAKPFLAAAGALLVQLGIARLLAGGVFGVLTIVVAGLATYVALLMAFGLGREEREIAGRLVQRFKRRR